LTIKFTRRSPAAARPAACRRQPNARSGKTARIPRPLDLLLASPLWPRPLRDGSQREHTSRSSRHSKNLLSLVDCPIDSVVKHRPHSRLGGRVEHRCPKFIASHR
jgi:hypothetical protein